MTKARAIYLLRKVLEFEFEELDPFDEDQESKRWTCNTFGVDEEEYEEIFD